MNFRRFVGSTARDAMRKLKEELGEDALILSNRPCAEGVEIIATVDAGIEPFTARPAQRPAAMPAAAASPARSSPSLRPTTHPLPAQRPVMSTLSFQDYVRERLAQNQNPVTAEAVTVPKAAPAPMAAAVPVAAAMPMPAAMAMPSQAASVGPATISAAQPAFVPPGQGAAPSAQAPFARASDSERAANLPAQAALPVSGSVQAPLWLKPEASSPTEFPVARPELTDEPAVWRARPRAAAEPALLDELREVKAMLRQQVASARWMGGETDRSPRAQRSHQLLDAGLSPGLIRYLMERMPEDLEAGVSQQWMEQALERNCRKSDVISDLLEKGGICALIGPTGVGKTTTIAKLAARAVIRHGAPHVALVTLDNFRVGAYEQLAVYGRLLGVTVHQARDGTALARLLQQQRHKKAILIDTVGVSQKDERLKDLLTALQQPGLQRVFVANAAAQGDTIDRALTAFHVQRGDAVILTKLDEVERLGTAIDCVVRHGLCLAGLTDGQRVPQDWRAADPCLLAHQVLRPHPADDPWQLDQTAAFDRVSTAPQLDDGAYV